MRPTARLAAAALALVTTTALAGPNDIDVSRLGNPSRSGTAVNAVPGANGSFRIMARELGAAISAANLMPPDTLGHAAFSVNIELSVVSMDGREPPVAGGAPLSEGFALPTERPFQGPLLVPSLHVRKGLPFSLELGGRVAWIEKSAMYAGTAELKWAPLEGFSALPDVGVRLHGSRLFNTRDFTVATGGLDLGLGKTFPIGGMVTLTPYAGYDLGFTGAHTAVLDFDRARTQPGRDSASDRLNPDVAGAYETVHFFQNPSSRFYAGVRFVGGVIQLGLELSATTFGSFEDETGKRQIPTVGAFNSTIGLTF